MSKKEIKEAEKLIGLKEKRFIFLRRCGAFIIDYLIINIIISLAFKSVISNRADLEGLGFWAAYNSMIADPSFSSLLLAMSISSACLAILYFAIIEFKLKQTLGKIIFKINVKSDAKELSMKQSFLRNLPKALVFIDSGLVLLIDLIYMLFKKKRLFDFLARTDVE